ncbi:coiled-coil domain-containing protein 174-like isoform X2 [Myxocyprinus asiaticus]|uniref:coiled-coil domain-containing protein 174-like isoform X2 n=1 Tax=Myxocyprinus asiaticus TaxID=70543 RepID=UPI002222F6BA|nr:coiled-coil domain-containing protein 174-like isoform X2 [Myxocyprinus asiaticus]
MDKKKKQYNVTASSLVDLKAELYRKQEEFKQDRLGQDAGAAHKSKTKTKKPNIWIKQNEGVNVRAQKDVQQNAEEENTLDKSRQKLEEKARLYEQMTKGDFPDEETEGLFLVDFTQKIINQRKDMHLHTKNVAGDRDGEGSDVSVPIPLPENSDEEWVDFVDALGRSRRCLRKDLPDFQKMDQDLQSKRVTGADRTLLSEDMRREMQREQWEREEEEQMKRPVGPIHYENIREQEARDLGVGYFAFSHDEEQRRKQRETLDMLRDQTTEQRSKREQLKDKRKALLEARLAKVRMRKMKKSKLEPGAEDDAPVVDGEENEDNDDEDLIGPPVAQTVTKVEVEIQERKDTKPGVPHVREWDRGKEFTWGQWTSHRRDERDSEFAPPSAYFTDDRKANHNRATDKGHGKGKLAFKWSESQRATERDTDDISTPGHSANVSTFTQPSQYPQPQAAQTQSLDDLLSYYKHST